MSNSKLKAAQRATTRRLLSMSEDQRGPRVRAVGPPPWMSELAWRRGKEERIRSHRRSSMRERWSLRLGIVRVLVIPALLVLSGIFAFASSW